MTRLPVSLAAASVLACLALACTPAAGDGDGGETGTDDVGTDTDTGETGGKEGPADPLVDHCNPSLADQCGEFVDPHLCCSDDPAALDLDAIEALVTPKYQGRPGEGTPLFSGNNNALSTSGVCVRDGDVPAANALADINAQGCPVPCNPTWAADDITTICGSGMLCCAMKELEPEDCVLDDSLGDAGCWRPVTGFDIAGLGGLEATDWGSNDHATHQDPSGLNCTTFAQGIPQDVLDSKGLSTTDVLQACYKRLTVANQRGLCLAGAGINTCPYAALDYVDACEQMNFDEGRVGCE